MNMDRSDGAKSDLVTIVSIRAWLQYMVTWNILYTRYIIRIVNNQNVHFTAIFIIASRLQRDNLN
jgi:hypothetical protein